jgi:hypothetical protein
LRHEGQQRTIEIDQNGERLSTSGYYKTLGVVVLVGGVLASFLVTVFLRNAMVIAQLRRPAAVLRDGFRRLQGTKNPPVEDGSATAKEILLWLDALADKALEDKRYVPDKLAPSIASLQITPEYQAHLDKAGNALRVMDRVVFVGLKKVLETRSGLDKTQSSYQKCLDATNTAWTKIDEISLQVDPEREPSLTPETADQAMLLYITAMETEIAGARGGGEQADSPGPLTPGTLEHLRFEISTLNLASWLLVAVLTSFVGSYAMVISHLDFGRPLDFVLAFLWGLGLPSVGAQLAQLTPSTIATGIGVTRPS